MKPSLPEKIKSFLKAHEAEALLTLIGLSLVGGGIFWSKVQGEEETKIEILETEEKAAPEIVVDVAGEVNKPGVYKLAGGARVNEAIELAGGIKGGADQEWINKYLNRSAKVNDGQKIYIPAKSEIKNSNLQTNSNSQNLKMININTASSGELEALAGVGPATAGKIIAGRPYARVEELTERKIVSTKVFEQNKDKISVW